jgi:hypothetical protein
VIEQVAEKGRFGPFSATCSINIGLVSDEAGSRPSRL